MTKFGRHACNQIGITTRLVYRRLKAETLWPIWQFWARVKLAPYELKYMCVQTGSQLLQAMALKTSVIPRGHNTECVEEEIARLYLYLISISHFGQKWGYNVCAFNYRYEPIILIFLRMNSMAPKLYKYIFPSLTSTNKQDSFLRKHWWGKCLLLFSHLKSVDLCTALEDRVPLIDLDSPPSVLFLSRLFYKGGSRCVQPTTSWHELRVTVLVKHIHVSYNCTR